MGDLVTGDGYRARMTCSESPVQIEGEVDGHALYFRARGGIWSVGISRDKLSEAQKADVFALFVPPDTHPIAQAIDGPYQYADSGVCDDHMDHELAWKMVLGAIAEFRNPTHDEDYP